MASGWPQGDGGASKAQAARNSGRLLHDFTPEPEREAKRDTTFNARVEGLEDKPMFRAAFQTQRCVIPLAGFWEWSQSGSTKVRIARKDSKPLLVAGLWNCIETPNGPLKSCTIVTRPPTPDLADVHNRMPALLLCRDMFTWLDGTPQEARAAALTSWAHRILQVTPAC